VHKTRLEGGGHCDNRPFSLWEKTEYLLSELCFTGAKFGV
jgi:hypothetical protein